ncbi:MAG: GspE/PulE family protein [Syntrophobacteraceae bacterium]
MKNLDILESMATEQSQNRAKGPGLSAHGEEQAGVVFEMLIGKGYLDEQKLMHAKRVHSKLAGNQSLIQVLLDLKYITSEQLRESLSAGEVNLKLGALLVELGLIRDHDLATALARQKASSPGKTLGEVLVESGLIEERSLMEVLSFQLGLPCRELEIARMDANLLRKTSSTFCARHQFLPIERSHGQVTVAFVDPLNPESLEAAEKIFGKVRQVLCSKTDFSNILKILENEALLLKSGRYDENSAAGVVSGIIEEALKVGASAIHIEPMKDRLRVRFRLDGVLAHHKDFPAQMGPAMTSRLKAMTGTATAESEGDRECGLQFHDPRSATTLYVRACFSSTVWGEKTILRLPGSKGVLLGLNAIGMYPKMLERFKCDALDIPLGLILLAGPKGSGKTTTLYSAINYLESMATNILTVEDPVESFLDGITQHSITAQKNLTFEESVKQAQNQDADIMVIGEIRDRFCAQACIQASLTGQKVLSTLDAEDCAAGLMRLLGMNMEAFLLCSTLVCVVSQRLLRKVCAKCSQDYIPEPVDLRRLGYGGGETRGVAFKVGHGCPQCRFTGYSGQVGVFELLFLNEPIRDALLNRKTSSDIRRIAVETSGLVTLFEDGIMKAAGGLTSLQEIFRCLPPSIKPRPINELKRLLGTE